MLMLASGRNATLTLPLRAKQRRENPVLSTEKTINFRQKTLKTTPQTIYF